MRDPVPRAERLMAPGWAGVTSSRIRHLARSGHRAALAGCAVVLLVAAIVAPLARQDVIDSVPVSIAFFATLLTGEAVIFAISFAPSSAWPSLREIDSHIAFRDWVVAGWLASMLTAIGLLTGSAIAGTYGALLFLLADVFGILSFVRLFGLASADGRKRLLCRTLGDALAQVAAPAAGLQQRMSDSPVLRAYLGQLEDAAARSDGNGVRALADELAAAFGGGSGGGGGGGGQAAVALHLEVMHRLAKAALVGKLDPVVAATAAEMLIDSLLAQVGASPPDGDTGETSAQHAAAVMAQTSRYLAWLASTSLTLSARQVTTASAARELVALSVRVRQRILRLADPDPRYAAGAVDLGTPLADTTCVLTWISGFTEFHGSGQAAGFYPVYEILTGTKFLGNYWDGDSVLTGLREALFTSGGVGTAAAEATRRAFGTAAEFDRIWTLISVGAMATLRDVRQAHPPELIRPEFTPDHQLLGAYVRTFASHRYFTTAQQAMTALTSTVGHAGPAGGLWQKVRAAATQIGWSVPMPAVEPHQRPSACVLAIAARLAPLAADEPDQQLRVFLNELPRPVLDAAAGLASRALPDPVPGRPSVTSPVELITDRLQVLQLVGTHRAGTA